MPGTATYEHLEKLHRPPSPKALEDSTAIERLYNLEHIVYNRLSPIMEDIAEIKAHHRESLDKLNDTLLALRDEVKQLGHLQDHITKIEQKLTVVSELEKELAILKSHNIVETLSKYKDLESKVTWTTRLLGWIGLPALLAGITALTTFFSNKH